MKRFHAHVSVRDLDESIRFYSALFGVEPAKREAGYAKWMLDDPRINFAISTTCGEAGVSHLGIQTDTRAELDGAAARAKAANAETVDQADAHCCYARSDKTWVSDPQGVRWETFFTHGDSTVYGEDRAREGAKANCGCA